MFGWTSTGREGGHPGELATTRSSNMMIVGYSHGNGTRWGGTTAQTAVLDDTATQRRGRGRMEGGDKQSWEWTQTHQRREKTGIGINPIQVSGKFQTKMHRDSKAS